jgi:hypothetical protein
MGACLGGLLSAWTRRTSASTCSTCTTPAVCACRRPRCYACSSPRWVGLLSVVGSSPSTPGVQVSGCSSTAGEQQSVATPQVNAMRENGLAHPADTPRTSLVVPFRAASEWRLSKPEAAERSFTLPADEAGVSKCADVRRPVAAIGLRASGAPVSAHPPALPVRTRPPHSGAAGGPSHPRRYPTYAHPLDVANSVPIKSRAPRRPHTSCQSALTDPPPRCLVTGHAGGSIHDVTAATLTVPLTILVASQLSRSTLSWAPPPAPGVAGTHVGQYTALVGPSLGCVLSGHRRLCAAGGSAHCDAAVADASGASNPVCPPASAH